MNEHHNSVRVGSGWLKVDHVAKGVWDYRISDPTAGINYRGQLEMADTEFGAMGELISRMLTATGLRRDRLDGGPYSLLERRFPQSVLMWADANHDELTVAEANLYSIAPNLTLVVGGQ